LQAHRAVHLVLAIEQGDRSHTARKQVRPFVAQPFLSVFLIVERDARARCRATVGILVAPPKGHRMTVTSPAAARRLGADAGARWGALGKVRVR
jgi:hypothetical protein